MKKIRTGNDIHIIWTITKNDAVTESSEPLDLSGAEVLLVDALKHAATFDYVINTIDDSTAQVVGTFFGKDQHTQGKYNLLLVKNRGEENMITLDYVDAFLLTCVSKFGVISGNDESSITTATIELDSDLVSYNGSPDMTLYYTKEEIDEMFLDYYTKTEVDDMLNLKTNNTDFLSHKNNSTIHVTAAQKTLWNSVRDKASEDEVTALRQYTSAFQREITDEVATKANASDVYTKTQTDTLLEAKADESDLTAHTEDTTIHVTQADKDNWNAKQSDLPLTRGAGSHSLKQYTGNATYDENIQATGSNTFTWSRGSYNNGTYQFNAGGYLSSAYLTNTDSTYTKYTVRLVASPVDFKSITTINSIHYYMGLLRDAFVGLRFYNSSNLSYYGKISSIDSFDITKPYEFVAVVDKTGAETSLTTASNLQVVMATNVNNGNYAVSLGSWNKNIGAYNGLLGYANYAASNFDYLFGRGNYANGLYGNVFGTNNITSSFGNDKSTRVYTNIFGLLNTSIGTNGKNIFGFQNTVSSYYGENNNTTYFDTIVGNNNTIATRGVFVGETINCPIKNSDQFRYMFGGFLNDNVNGKTAATIIGQFNDTYSPNATWVMASGDRSGQVRHNSLEVTHTNNVFTTNLKDNILVDGTATFNDTVSIGQIANVETTINGKQNVLSYYVENSSDPILGLYRHAGVEKTINNTTIALNGIAGTNSTSGTMVGTMLLDMSNLLAITNMIDNTGVHLIYTVGQADTKLDVNSNGVVVTTPTNKTFTYNGNEVATVDQLNDQTRTICIDDLNHSTTNNIVVDGVTYYYDPDLVICRGQKLKATATGSGTFVALAAINNGTMTIVQETLGQLLEFEWDAVSDVTVLVYNGSTLNDPYFGIKVWDTVESLSVKSDKAVTSYTSNLKIEVVSAMPATPDANTIYIVV